MTGIEQSKLAQRAATIRKLNDAFRKDMSGGHLMLSMGVMARTDESVASLVRAVMEYQDFDEDEGPYAEHDSGEVSWQGKQCFWNIAYYDKDLLFRSPDPTNPEITIRALMLMLAEER